MFIVYGSILNRSSYEVGITELADTDNADNGVPVGQFLVAICHTRAQANLRAQAYAQRARESIAAEAARQEEREAPKPQPPASFKLPCAVDEELPLAVWYDGRTCITAHSAEDASVIDHAWRGQQASPAGRWCKVNPGHRIVTFLPSLAASGPIERTAAEWIRLRGRGLLCTDETYP